MRIPTWERIKLQGAPAAIEVKDYGLHYPELLMYYPEYTRVYTAVLQGGDKDTFRSDWVIRGPYEISRRDYAALRRVLAERGPAVPPLEVYGKVYQFAPSLEAPQVVGLSVPQHYPPILVASRSHSSSVQFARANKPAKPYVQASSTIGAPVQAVSVLEPEVPVFTPTPTPAPKKKKLSKKEKAARKGDPRIPSFDEMDPKKWRPLNSDQMAIAIAQGYAERNNRGDVIHIVESDKETLFEIASWYTGAGIHEGKLQEINDLAANSTLKKGTKIRIPIEYLKRVRRFPTAP
jgi:hypothetical protein